MRVESTFTVASPVERVWEAVVDIERVAPCLPGAQVLERVGEDAHAVALKVKVGPISLQYRAEVEVVERDDSRRRAVLSGKAKEVRGQGTARGRAEIRVAPEGERTRAHVSADLQVSGRLASLGQGLIADVADQLCESFAANLAAMLDTGPAAGDGAAHVAAAGAADARSGSRPGPLPVASELPLLPVVAGALGRRLGGPAGLVAGGVALFALGFLAGRC